jgi:hypothetical protein
MIVSRRQEKIIKHNRHNSYRPLPVPDPPYRTVPTTSTTHNDGGNQSTQGTTPIAGDQWHPSNWMMLPTMEEFGVRRPFDAVGQPGKGDGQWPMMSRTMMHVSLAGIVSVWSGETVHGGKCGRLGCYTRGLVSSTVRVATSPS